MASFAELPESELSTILEERDAENNKKATKHISRLLARKRFEGSRAFDIKTTKVKLANANACMSN